MHLHGLTAGLPTTGPVAQTKRAWAGDGTAAATRIGPLVYIDLSLARAADYGGGSQVAQLAIGFRVPAGVWPVIALAGTARHPMAVQVSATGIIDLRAAGVPTFSVSPSDITSLEWRIILPAVDPWPTAHPAI